MVDDRPGRDPAVVITDRSHHKLKYFTPDGQYLSTVEGFLLPCHFDLHGDLMVVPDLDGRVTLLDKDNHPLVHLADDAAWRKQVDEASSARSPTLGGATGSSTRTTPASTHDGDIIVTDWVEPGRVIKLTRLT